MSASSSPLTVIHPHSLTLSTFFSPSSSPRGASPMSRPGSFSPPLRSGPSVAVTASVSPSPTLSSFLSRPGVQAVGGAIVLASLYHAAQYLLARYRLRLSPSPVVSADSTSAHAPRGSSRSTNPYETPTQLHEYLMMHYALPSTLLVHTDVPDIPWSAMHFPAECARLCVALLKSSPQWGGLAAGELRALDVGCAVGRSTFELARAVGEVVGIDFSHSFIDAANELRRSGRVEYSIRVEGDVAQRAVAEIHPAIDRSRVSFYQGDACSLPSFTPHLAPFHVVLAANLICRLPHPLRFLSALPSLVLPHGFVLLFSPHTWLEDYTAREEWLGGYYDAQGNAVRTAQRLKEVMEEGGRFALVGEQNVPFFIRETYRKNQWSISHLTCFQRTTLP